MGANLDTFGLHDKTEKVLYQFEKFSYFEFSNKYTKKKKYMMHSPEVELTEIFVSNIFNGNGLAPSDKPPDTKNTTRGVHNFRILKIL